MHRHFGGGTGRRSYAAAFALLAVVVVLAYAAYRPTTRREAVRWVRPKDCDACRSSGALLGLHSSRCARRCLF